MTCNESSYTIPMIMPCFYCEQIGNDPEVFLCFLKKLMTLYEDCIKNIDQIEDNNVFKRFEKEYSKLWDNFTDFGFIIIFCYCLSKSDILCHNDNIKLFFENKFSNINNDILGFNLYPIKRKINNLLGIINDDIRLAGDIDVDDIRLTSDTGDSIDTYYSTYFDYIKKSKRRMVNNNRGNNIKVKRVFMVCSSCFRSSTNKFSKIIDYIGDNEFGDKNIEYVDIAELEIIDKYNLKIVHSDCNCDGNDCKEMISLCFKN